MGSSQSSQAKLDKTTRRYILNVPDPKIWQKLQSHGISPVVLPPLFAPQLLPAFVSILESFDTLEYRQALDKCGDFMDQLTALKHELGIAYDTTARCYSILRIMIQIETGFYFYPKDLPFHNPPHLDPVPDAQSAISNAYIVHRLLSATFDTTERAASQLKEYGWTYEKSNAMVKNNISFFKSVLPRFKPKPQTLEPLPELHVSIPSICYSATMLMSFWVWFWVYFLPYITDRQQTFVSYTSSLNKVTEMFTKILPTLVTRLSNENRPELLGQLCRKLNVLDLNFPGELVPACQTLLSKASTRFQHVMLRQTALLSAKSLAAKGKISESVHRSELASCSDICQQSGMIALSADLVNNQAIDEFDNITKLRDLWEKSGRFDFAQAADGRRAQFLLNKGDATITIVSSEPVRRILKDMYDRESFLMGQVDMRNGHRSYLFDKLVQWSTFLLAQSTPSLPLVCFIATFSIEAHRRAVEAGRAPDWNVGQKVLTNSFLLLGCYFAQVFLGDVAPQFLERLLVDTAWMLLNDARRISPPVPASISDAAALYLTWAPLHARRGDSSELAKRLEAVQAFAEREIDSDMNRRQYVNAVSKCAAVLEISLYHPGRTHMKSIYEAGDRYTMATNILSNDSLWTGNEIGRATGTSALNRVKGAWIAWTDSAGQYREPGTPRRMPSEPDTKDFWTYDWVSLAMMSDLWRNPHRRLKMIEDQGQRDMRASLLSTLKDGYLKDCIAETRKVFDELRYLRNV